MMMTFSGWSRFRARRYTRVTTSWLRRVRVEAQKIFRAGMTNGPHTGRIYRRRGKSHQASAQGEYPAKDTGRLLASLRGESNTTEAVIGTNMYYARYLRRGTKHMARRRMSDSAMREGREAVEGPAGFVAWQRMRQ